MMRLCSEFIPDADRHREMPQGQAAAIDAVMPHRVAAERQQVEAAAGASRGLSAH
jgi:hypothetical protein